MSFLDATDDHRSGDAPSVPPASPAAEGPGEQSPVETVRPPTGPALEREEDREARRQGRSFLVTLHAAIRAATLYPLQNAAVQHALSENRAILASLLATDGRVVVLAQGPAVSVNGVRIQSEMDTFASLSAVLKTFRDFDIGEMAVLSMPAPDCWARAVDAFTKAGRGVTDPDAKFRALLALMPLDTCEIRLRPSQDVADNEPVDETVKVRARRAYTASVSAFKRVVTESRMGRNAGRRELKRAVQGLVDQVMRGETALLGMTTLRDYDEYTFVHSVNVAVFAMAIGRRLGFSHKQLYHLGNAGLFHDLGKSRVPIDVLNNSGPMSDSDWAHLKRHPWQGVLQLHGVYSPDQMPLEAATATYEHHLKIDASGYPAVIRPRLPLLFSRIIAVADGFDAATAKRVYQEVPMEPGSVLKGMIDNPRFGLDQIVVKALIQTIGVFPIGSLVVLDTYELAVVQSPNPITEHQSRPLVLIIADGFGQFQKAAPVDLADVDPVTGQFRRTIIKIADPERYGIRVSTYLP